MDKQTTLTALSHIRRIGNLMNEFMDLSQQIGQALDRNDIVAVKMLMSMRRETAHGMKTARRSLQREIRTVPDRKERERIRALLNGAEPDGSTEERSLAAGVSANKRLLKRTTEIDRMLSQRIARDKSIYQTRKSR